VAIVAPASRCDEIMRLIDEALGKPSQVCGQDEQHRGAGQAIANPLRAEELGVAR
jgi:hypothetical protein